MGKTRTVVRLHFKSTSNARTHFITVRDGYNLELIATSLQT